MDFGNLPEWIESSTGLVALYVSLNDRRRTRGSDFSDKIFEGTPLSAEEVAEALRGSDELCELVEAGLESAMSSSAESKRRLLARVVVSALNGDGLAIPDEYPIFMNTVRELQPPHVQLLVLLATPPTWQTQFAGTEIEGALTDLDIGFLWEGVIDTLPALEAALEKQGLIHDVGPKTYGGMNLRAFTLTRYGRRFLLFLAPDDLRSLDLTRAELVARFESAPSNLGGEGPGVIIKNLGPGTAHNVRVTSEVNEHGQQPFRDDPIEPFDLRPWDQNALRAFPPTLTFAPPYEFRLMWNDGGGGHESVVVAAEKV